MKGCQRGSQQVEKWGERQAEDLMLAENARIRQDTSGNKLNIPRAAYLQQIPQVFHMKMEETTSVSPLNKEGSENSHTTKLLEFSRFKKMTLCPTSITCPCLQISVQSRHCQTAEIHQFASKMSFFQIWETHSFLRRKHTEDTEEVGKKNNSDWVYGTWSSRKKAESC